MKILSMDTRPKIIDSMVIIIPMMMLWLATCLASSIFFAPINRAISDVVPIRIPEPIAIMKNIIGNVRVMAASASELSRPMNIASMMLKAV